MSENSTVQTVTCSVCPRQCQLAEGQKGYCRARVARNGRVVSESYGRLTSLSLDAVEKKPLARFHSGSNILSVGSYGCNMDCNFCQNHDISHGAAGKDAWPITPEDLAERALELRPQRNVGVAFTYNEPAIGYEFVRDTGRIVRQKGMVNVVVTNGYFNTPVLDELLECVDAFNIDLKCFSEEGYRSLGGQLEPVKRTIARAAEHAHVEVTTLVVPGLADSEDQMEAEAKWLASLDDEIPLHLTRYFPRWQAHGEATSPEVLRDLANVARCYLRYVYIGNL